MSRLPLQDRLLNCSTVCHAWRAAAAAATSAISSEVHSQSQCGALTSWLKQHSAAVHVLSLQGVYDDKTYRQHKFQLPLLPNLRSMPCICMDVSATLIRRQPLPTQRSTHNIGCSDSDSSSKHSGSGSDGDEDRETVMQQQQQELLAIAAAAVPSPRPARVRVPPKEATGGMAPRGQLATRAPSPFRVPVFTHPTMTQLTSLQLSDCAIFLPGLYLATALQRLALCSTAEPSCCHEAYAQQVQWGRLVQLTQLQLVEALEPGGLQAWELKDAYLKPIRRLTRLKVRSAGCSAGQPALHQPRQEGAVG